MSILGAGRPRPSRRRRFRRTDGELLPPELVEVIMKGVVGFHSPSSARPVLDDPSYLSGNEAIDSQHMIAPAPSPEDVQVPVATHAGGQATAASAPSSPGQCSHVDSPVSFVRKKEPHRPGGCQEAGAFSFRSFNMSPTTHGTQATYSHTEHLLIRKPPHSPQGSSLAAIPRSKVLEPHLEQIIRSSWTSRSSSPGDRGGSWPWLPLSHVAWERRKVSCHFLGLRARICSMATPRCEHPAGSGTPLEQVLQRRHDFLHGSHAVILDLLEDRSRPEHRIEELAGLLVPLDDRRGPPPQLSLGVSKSSRGSAAGAWRDPAGAGGRRKRHPS